jgi:hypothetical protein
LVVLSAKPQLVNSSAPHIYTKSISIAIISGNGDIAREVTPLTNQVFRSRGGIVEGLALLVVAGLVMAGLSACGAPAFRYVADYPGSTYFKVPTGWDSVSGDSLDGQVQTKLATINLDLAANWDTAYDANAKQSASDYLSFQLSRPFVVAEVVPLTAAARDEASYNLLRDFFWPITASARQGLAETGNTALSNFIQLRDVRITAKNGVHGVRDEFEYTFQKTTDVWDEVVLTNADQTVVYFLMVHCSRDCYIQNFNDINTVMSSFTIGS